MADDTGETRAGLVIRCARPAADEDVAVIAARAVAPPFGVSVARRAAAPSEGPRDEYA